MFETAKKDYIINVKGLNKYFGKQHVVKNVDIAVEKGRITGFLGPNGSGKTTTLRMLCGLLTPDSGEGEVLGLNFRKYSDIIKLQTGYMTQKFSLYDDMTIEENLMFIARIYDLPDTKKVVKASLDKLKLFDRRKQLVGALSGGWKQRLALAAATIHSPKLLLLDEPTAGVDPQARRIFWDEIHKLAAEGLTVLVSTHYMDEAERCHDIGYILNGKLIIRGTSEEIIKNSQLITYKGSGSDISKIVSTLEKQPGILQVSAFGVDIHISAKTEEEIKNAIKPFENKYKWGKTNTTLEEIFIQITNQNPDDRYKGEEK